MDQLEVYYQGYVAYELEYNTDDNPYEIGTDNYNQWMNGFEDAERDTT